jgi:excisionase family DNA binding protein
MGKMISLDAAAERVGASKRTVRRLISTGQLRAYRIGRTMVRVDSDDLATLFKPIAPSDATVGPSPVAKRVPPKAKARSRTNVA